MAVEEDDGKEEEEGSDGVGDRGTRGDEDWEDGDTEDISKLTEGMDDASEKEEITEYSPGPDVRLARNI